MHYTILQMLHLQLGSNQVLTYFLNLVIDVKGFTLEESLFLIFGPKAIKLLSYTFQTCDV